MQGCSSFVPLDLLGEPLVDESVSKKPIPSVRIRAVNLYCFRKTFVLHYSSNCCDLGSTALVLLLVVYLLWSFYVSNVNCLGDGKGWAE